ncbi:uncharacterized protein PRCAT00001717001 [Priceomyces carsonii]|uniref:uncharacterized protein n=1 Tax=Priceomyces carsonii TaxID=28549 RepID=UPI002EDBA5CB|nr:unnamed protein product [Priceomyces carsonii]
MSIVEFLTTIDKLVQSINDKNQELEDLKKTYNSKLEIINKYVKKLQELHGELDVDPLSKLTHKQFIRNLENSVLCPNCDEKVWSLDADSDYILFPKTQLMHLLPEFPEGNCAEDIQAPVIEKSKPEQNIQIYHNTQRNIEKNTYRSANLTTPKKTCSYCKKPGHSRSKCFIRLSKPTK